MGGYKWEDVTDEVSGRIKWEDVMDEVSGRIQVGGCEG